MHGQYHRRRPHAERDPLGKRQNPAGTSDGGAVDGGSDDFPHPITLTFVETIPIATSSSLTEWTTSTSYSTILGIPTVSPGSTFIPTSTDTISETTSSSATSTTTSATESTSTTSSSSSSSTANTSSSTLPSSATPSSTNGMTHTDQPQRQGALASPSSTLSGGGIAGIVIGILALLAIVALILLRQRSIRKRKYAAGAWARRSVSPPVPTFDGYSDPQPFASASSPVVTNDPASPTSQVEGRVGRLAVRNVAPGVIAAPPAALNSPATPLTAQPVPTVMSPSMSTVVCTFITTLPDELAIGIGEKIRVLAEYDDGWVLGMNTSGEQGMIPLECLDRDISKKNPISLIESRNSRRISSLNVLRASSSKS